MLIGEKITKSYGMIRVLNNVSITVVPGKVTVLLGPSGAGKTTLIRTLALLSPPDQGKVEIDGETFFPLENRSKTIKPPWPRVTVVFQELFLWPHLTLKDNILLPLKLNHMDFTSLEDITKLFGMGEFITRYPNEVSVGQRQRAALARAVILNPAYILLDEITSALDVEQTNMIMNYLMVLRDRGIGLLIVTHHLSFARRLLSRREGDQGVFLGDDGSILECGDIDIFDNPKHPRLRKFLSLDPTEDPKE